MNIAILLGIALPFSIYFVLVTSSSGDKDDMFCAWILMIFILASLSISINQAKYNYREGQIDALTGNIKYELIIQPDSTRVWVEILEEKK